MHAHAHMYMHACTYIHSCTHAHSHTVQSHLHMYSQTHARTYTHTCTHIYIYIHTIIIIHIQQAMDFRNGFVGLCYDSNYSVSNIQAKVILLPCLGINEGYLPKECGANSEEIF